MLHRGYETVKAAHDRIQDDIPTFTEIFAPEVKVFDALGDVLIPMLTLAFFGTSAFMERGKYPSYNSQTRAVGSN